MFIDLKYFLYLILALYVNQTKGQLLPPVSHYTPKTYNADNQNWSIDQGENGHIYVANNKGLLTYNGESWHVYDSPNESIFRSVFVDDEKIYTGCFRDFGYWQRDPTGKLNYTSLTKKLKIDIDEDEQFWKILKVDNNILFQSLHNIYSVDINTDNVTKISPQHGIYKVFKVDNRLFISQPKHGIYQLQSGQIKLINDSSVFKNNSIINLYKINDEVVVQTDQAGIRKLNDADFIWPNQKGSKNLNVYSSIHSSDKLILGTVSNGIVVLNEDGKIIQNLNAENALSNNTVLSLMEDQNNNIWAGLDNGINQVNYQSAIKTYNDQTGEIGTVYASKKHNDLLYLGTNQGLFYKKINQHNTDFKLVKGTNGQIWSLFIYDNKLFCGHNNGTFLIKKDQSKKISELEGTWCFKKVPDKEDLILQGNYNGISIIEKKDKNWILKNKIEGFNISSKSVHFVARNKLIIDHEYKGVFTVSLNDKLTKAINVEPSKGVEKGLYSGLSKFSDTLIYSNRKGLFKYSDKREKFIKDSLLTHLAYGNSKYSSGKIVPTSENAFWSFTGNSIRFVERSNLNKGYKVTLIPVSSNKRNAMVGYENISILKNQEYIFGTSSGFWVIDIAKFKNQLKTLRLELNSVKIKNLQKGIDKRLPLETDDKIDIEYSMNSLNFDVSIVDFKPYMETEYSYKIEGYHNDWSKWSMKNNIEFENLPFGEYKLRVKGRIGKQVSANEVNYRFSIKRPSLLSTTMIIIYVFILLSLLFVFNLLHKKHYKKQKKKIQENNKRKLELKKLESQKEIMKVKNEQLEKDVESKNRELAISTMSLIKKNEFLNRLKQEIKETKTPKNAIQRVLHLIDKNINNTDDWKFFEEAFNNADKDFLKKVKAKHPSLTSNDLKLCAYLRLNLSSKEIAPLFNISVKSVEVKRYRLRKKMNLEHDDSLTNYILEL